MDFVIKRRAATFLGILLAASIVAVSGSVYLNERAQRQEDASHRWIEHTYQVKLLLRDTLKCVVDLETGARGFALTLDDELLEPLRTAEDSLRGLGVALTTKVAGDSAQTAKAQQLLALVNQKVRHAQGLVALARTRVSRVAMLDHVRRGNALTEEIRSVGAEMGKVEEGLLRQHTAAHAKEVATSHQLAWLLVGMQVLLWAALFVLVRHALRAQAIVTVCSWSKTICYHDEWISFEEYLQRRFGVQISHGISPAETQKFLRAFPGGTQKDGQGSSSS